MRGKDIYFSIIVKPTGITPAHAGKRYILFHHRQANRDHPRTCGEKGISASESVCLGGSPPHMRGKVKWYNKLFYNKQDHPRTCGEKVISDVIMYSPMGSPPHMRGKEDLGGQGNSKRRITPAHAGKSYNRR